MLIDESRLTHWINCFYGYGSWSAPLWFVSYEETGGETPEEVADKINYFQRVHPVEECTLCDARALYRHVGISWDGPKGEKYANRYDFRFGSEAVLHGAWKNLIAFMHGYEGRPVPDLLSYQRTFFLSPSVTDAALIPLFPLPSDGHAWHYSWLDLPSLPFLKGRALYEQKVYPSRINNLFNLIARHQPKLVLMYGMNSIHALKASAQAFYPATRFTSVKAVSRQTPPYHVTSLGNTRLLITTQIPALRHNRVETGFDWEQLGRTLNGGST